MTRCWASCCLNLALENLYSSWLKGSGLGFRVQGLRSRVWSSRFRVQGSRSIVGIQVVGSEFNGLRILNVSHSGIGCRLRHFTLYSEPIQPYTLYCEPYTLNPVPHTLSSIPHTRISIPHTLNPIPCSRKPSAQPRGSSARVNGTTAGWPSLQHQRAG